MGYSVAANPPGKTIEEQLKIQNISLREFANKIGEPERWVRDELFAGNVQLTHEIAVKLEEALGPPSRFWENLELIYRSKLKRLQVEKFLERFHESRSVNKVFTNGCCYWFAFILHNRFEGSKMMYDQIENHFATLINGRLYDITGDVTEKYNMEPWDELDDELLKSRIIRDCVLF